MSAWMAGRLRHGRRGVPEEDLAALVTYCSATLTPKLGGTHAISPFLLVRNLHAVELGPQRSLSQAAVEVSVSGWGHPEAPRGSASGLTRVLAGSTSLLAVVRRMCSVSCPRGLSLGLLASSGKEGEGGGRRVRD